MPADVPVADAVANVAAASQLVLGIERSDLTLISRGLADRLHQPHRAAPLPALDGAARAGDGPRGDRRDDLRRRARPALLVLLAGHGKVTDALRERIGSWAEIRRAPFTPLGADVPEL